MPDEPFFRPPPPPPPPPEREPMPWDRRDDVIGVVVPIAFVLARTDDVAVAVWGVTAFPNGFDVTVTQLTRGSATGRLSQGRRFPGFPGMPGAAGDLPDDFLRFGVELADGTRVTNVGPPPRPRSGEASGAFLMPRGGGGNARRHSQGYWVSPLPPPGDVTFVCEWPVFAIGETRHVVAAGPIVDASTRCTPVWPDG